MSNGIFHTKGKGSLQDFFFEYSNSTTVDIQTEIVEYERTLGKPAFDLIIGTKTMNELGIILDFNTKVITKPRRLPRIQELLKIPKADAGNLCSSITPAQNTRSKTTQARLIEGLCEVRTIDHEMFLACIQTYTKVTHKPVNPARLAQQKFPTEMINAVLT